MSSGQRTHGGLSVKTLLIAGAASATAALVIPMLWRPGTVFAAAMTPIVVALVSELLRRPVDTVNAVRVRRTTRGTAILDPPADDEPFDPLAPPSQDDLAALPRATEGRRAEHRRRPLSGRQWKLALATGLVAFAVVAAVLTTTELLAGDAVSGGGGRTTFFSSGSKSKRDQPATDQERKQSREREPSATPTAEPTTTPEATATPTPTPSATPTPTVTPAPTAEAPAPAQPTPSP